MEMAKVEPYLIYKFRLGFWTYGTFYLMIKKVSTFWYFFYIWKYSNFRSLCTYIYNIYGGRVGVNGLQKRVEKKLLYLRSNLTRVMSPPNLTPRRFQPYLLSYISFLSSTFLGATYRISLLYFPGFLVIFIFLSSNNNHYIQRPAWTALLYHNSRKYQPDKLWDLLAWASV